MRFNHIIYRSLAALILISISLNANALQQIHTQVAGEKIKLNISNTTLSRIAIKGDRITKIITDASRFDVETDPVSGAIFIRSQNKQAFPLFLTTESGQTYQLLLKPQATAADNFEIIPHDLSSVVADTSSKRASYESTITPLISSMASNQLPVGFSQLADKDLPSALSLFGNNIKAKPRAAYQGKYLRGIVFTLTNTGKSTINLDPSLLHSADVIAIAFADDQLAAQQSTQAYQVRQIRSAGLRHAN